MTDWPRVTVQQLQAKRRARRVLAIVLSACSVIAWPVLLLVEDAGIVATLVVSILLSILAELVEMNANLIGRG